MDVCLSLHIVCNVLLRHMALSGTASPHRDTCTPDNDAIDLERVNLRPMSHLRFLSRNFIMRRDRSM